MLGAAIGRNADIPTNCGGWHWHNSAAKWHLSQAVTAEQAHFQVIAEQYMTSRLFIALLSVAVLFGSIACSSLYIPWLSSLVITKASEKSASINHISNTSDQHMSIKRAMSKLSHARITPHRSNQRGEANHGWLDTKHTFSFASYQDGPNNFGSLRVLNEDRVAPGTGFPTHPHRDFEIFSYILSGELTHRDSMLKKGAEGKSSKDQFYRMHRGDVQFTTGGRGIAHSEQNEHRYVGLVTSPNSELLTDQTLTAMTGSTSYRSGPCHGRAD